MNPRNATPELLIAHGDGLRALARSLVGDADADELVQETWLAALTRPPRREGELGGWLRTVLVNVARKRRRGAEARRGREEGAARGEREADAPIGLAQRRDVLQGLTRAVSELDEPFQEVVFLRFFEGLERREIARRLGVPEATVRSRLWRALERLRERLDRESGGRERWVPGLVALTGLERAVAPTSAASAATVSTLALVMASKTKLAAVGALLALALFLVWWIPNLFATPGEIAEAVAVQPASLASAVPVELAPVRAETAEEPPPAPPEPPALAALGPESTPKLTLPEVVEAPGRPFGDLSFELVVGVFDPDDVPLPGASVFVAPLRHPMNRMGTTGALGGASVRWKGEVSPMTVAVAVLGPQKRRLELRRITLHAGRAGWMRIALIDEPRWAAHRDIPAWHRPAKPELADLGYIQVDEHRGWESKVRLLPSALLVAPEPHEGHFRFTSLPSPRGVRAAGTSGDVFDPDGLGGDVEGVVLDAYGRAAAGAMVTIYQGDAGRAIGFRADDAGRFRLEGIRAGRWWVFAGGGPYGQSRRELQVVGGREVGIALHLDREVELVGELFTTTQRPRSGWRLLAVNERDGAVITDVGVVGPDGGFSFANVERGSYTIEAWPERETRGFPPLAFRAAAGSGFASVALDDLYDARIEVDLSAYEDDVDVRMWSTRTGRGMWLHQGTVDTYRGDTWLVPPGNYELEVGTVRRGWVVAEARVEVLSRNLQRPALLEPGRLEVMRGGGDEWELWRRDDEVASFVDHVRRDRQHYELPAGTYEARPRSGKGTSRTFVLLAGTRAVLVLGERAEDD